MKSRKYLIGIVALALGGALAWWLIPRGGTLEAEVPDPNPSSDTPNEVNVTPPSLQPAVIESEPDLSRPEEQWSAANAPERPEKREFESAVDSDPALSRELEAVVQRSLDVKLDRSKMDVESLVCRGNSCQIIFTRQSQTAGAGGMSAVSTLLRDLTDATVRNPNTGAQLKPMVQMVRGDTAGIVTVIAFENL